MIRGLYVVTPDTPDTAALLAMVEAALSGGAALLQYRNKAAAARLRETQARALLAIARRYRVPLIVNDDLALAIEIDADGVHLGALDGDLGTARARLAPGKLLGASCYDQLESAIAARAAGADYVAFGAAYPSRTKPGAVRASAALFAAAKRRLDCPIVAIGGIDAANTPALIDAGVDAVAVVSAVFGATDVGAAAHAIARLFERRPVMNEKSRALFERAQQAIPAGVNSPVRAFRAVGGTPRFIERGVGARVYDADGHEYLDYVLSWGPLILGHAHPAVIEAVQRAAADGLSFGMPTEPEIELVERIRAAMPSIEMARLVSSGTEATMSALRLARGFTGRSRIIKFEGCYHGHADSLLVKAGSGALTFGHPSSAGVPPEIAQHTQVLAYNDSDQLVEAFAHSGDAIAAVIVEPVAGNMNLVPPQPQFLATMRELCTRHGAVLIFDEVMTGFRVHPGGAQALYGITPDLTTLGKVIGGGMPVGAYGGRRDIMQRVSPLGPVYQAGTLSGNPVAVAAGNATLAEIAKPGFYDRLFAATARFVAGLNAAAERHRIAFSAASVGSMFGMYFRAGAPCSLAQVSEADQEAFKRFFHAALDGGVHFAPSAFEAGFTSSAHGEAEIAQTLRVVGSIFERMSASA